MPAFLVAFFAGVLAPMVWADVAVTTARLSDRSSATASTYAATVEPMDVSAVSAGISAEIIALDARPGDSVRAGDRLALLDCRDAILAERASQAQRDDAEVQLAFAQRQAERIAKLAASNIASEELKDTRATEVLRARQALEMRNIALEDAQLQVSRCTVRAPFDAVVSAQLASVGARVQAGAPIVELQSQAVEVRVQVPVTVNVDPTQRVSFFSGPEETPLAWGPVAGAVDSDSATRLVRFVARDRRLLPGLPGRVTIFGSAQTLPSDYLVEREGQFGLMVAVDGTARFLPRPNAVLGQAVDVSDLSPDTQLIESGRFRVREGDTLVITP